MTKRLFDLFWSALGLVALTPLFGLVAVLIKRDSAGPVFFRQERVGRSGAAFRIFKFRTMRAASEGQGLLTVSNDDRVTKIGRVLRKSKVDELPQLINVLIGDMSLVGPRPEVPKYVALYPKDLRDKVLTVRPGITDLASIEFRDENELLEASKDPHETYLNEILPKKLAYCSRYVDEQSVFLDFTIILRTLARIIGFA